MTLDWSAITNDIVSGVILMVIAALVGLCVGCAKRMSRWLVRRAARRLEGSASAAYEEEWLANVSVSSRGRALRFALDLQRGAEAIRTALSNGEPAETAAMLSFGDPQTPIELRLAGLWREVLRLDRVDVRDDFFSSGGHSLSAIRLMTRIHQEFGVKLTARVLFENVVFADLARRIEAALLPS